MVDVQQTDFIDPAKEDWTKKADSTLYYAAKDGVPQAQAEIARRDREHTPPIENDQD